MLITLRKIAKHRHGQRAEPQAKRGDFSLFYLRRGLPETAVDGGRQLPDQHDAPNWDLPTEIEGNVDKKGRQQKPTVSQSRHERDGLHYCCHDVAVVELT